MWLMLFRIHGKSSGDSAYTYGILIKFYLSIKSFSNNATEMLFIKWLIGSYGFVDLVGDISIRVEVNWPLGEDSSSSFFLFILSQLN